MTQQEKQKLLAQIAVLLDSIPLEREIKPTEKAYEKPQLLTIKECAAEINGLSEHTVRMLLHRASCRISEPEQASVVRYS